jgi:hypothetical protein
MAAANRIKTRIMYLLCTLRPLAMSNGGKTASGSNRVLAKAVPAD